MIPPLPTSLAHSQHVAPREKLHCISRVCLCLLFCPWHEALCTRSLSCAMQARPIHCQAHPLHPQPFVCPLCSEEDGTARSLRSLQDSPELRAGLQQLHLWLSALWDSALVSMHKGQHKAVAVQISPPLCLWRAGLEGELRPWLPCRLALVPQPVQLHRDGVHCNLHQWITPRFQNPV